MRYRTATSLFIVLALMLASFVAACGDDGQTPDGPTVLTPSGSIGPSGSPSAGGSPSPGVSSSGQSPTPDTIEPTASPTVTPTGGASPISDAAIRQEILRLFAQSPALANADLEVSVQSSGFVYLSGTVHKKVQKTTAEQLAVNVPGVKRVYSWIFVKSGPQY